MKLLFLTSFYFILFISFRFYLNLCNYVEYVLHLLETQDTESTYDYIIVGCGTAGSLIAHYLSSWQGIKIIVLEAGGSGGPLLNPPSVGPLLQGSIHDWQYETTPQEDSCGAMEGKKCKWPMGKILGGSAKLNNMIHLRGYLPEMVPWFDGKYNISELIHILEELEAWDLPYENLAFKTQLPGAILEAAKELGHGVNNLNEINQTGFMETLVNQRYGGRWTTSHSLLFHHFSNCKVVTNAVAEKVLFDPKTIAANGIVYEKFGQKRTVFASKGIILTAGSIATPKLLMLSGIGPKEHLDTVKIPIHKDLPVGNNLVDHITTGLDLILLNTSLDFSFDNLLSPVSMWEYFVKGTGPWTSSGCEAIAILKTSELKSSAHLKEKTNCISPDIQLMILSVGLLIDNGVHLQSAVGITDHVWHSYFKKVITNNSISILPIVLHPKSTGFVRLRSNLPSDKPVIDPKYFSDSRDVDILLKGIEFIKRLLKTESMTKLGAILNPNSFPGCEHLTFDSKEYWTCYVKQLTLTSFHPAGTCRMGHPESSTSVVDYNFKVIGTQNLFVADASIFPMLPSGNINTAVGVVASIFSKQLFESNLNTNENN